MKASLFRRLPLVILALVVAIPPAFAKGPSDVTQFGHDIRVGADQKVGELTCFNCSVYVRGPVGGDITTFYGNVVIDESGVVGGEVTAFLGDVRLDSGTKIGGDVTVFGGKVIRPPRAVIGGQITVFQGTTLLVLFLIFAGIIALIVWLVRRRHRSPTWARAA